MQPHNAPAAGLPSEPIKMLRLQQVKEATGLSSTSIYEQVNAGTFPKQIRLGPRCVGWIESEVQQWLAKRIQARRASDTQPA